MKVTKINTTYVISQELEKIEELLHKLNLNYQKYKRSNIVVVLNNSSNYGIEDLSRFLEMSTLYKSINKSFIIVSKNMISDHVPTELSLVPTIREAHNIIEMEDIERDLGV